jgi:hypothetical protein
MTTLSPFELSILLDEVPLAIAIKANPDQHPTAPAGHDDDHG